MSRLTSMGRTGLLLALSGCAGPDVTDAFTRVDLFAPDGGEGANAAFVEVIDSAETFLAVALPAADAPAVTDALIEAWDRGVEVEVVTDVDQESDPGIQALIAAEIPVQLADGAIGYFDFNQNRDVSWSSTLVRFTHAYAIADQRRFAAATRAGDRDPGTALVLRGRSEDLTEDLLYEHNQVFGGIDSTALTAFSSPAKSIADMRWIYPTQTEVPLQMWLGPQERVTKRIIDAAYGAKQSIWILTDDFANDGLARALQEKAAAGFDVQVVTGPRLGSSSGTLTNVLRNDTPDVQKSRITAEGRIPTLVLIDYDRARDDRLHTARAMFATHDLYSSSRFFRGQEVVNDQLIDGMLFVYEDHREAGSPLADEMLLLEQVWLDHLNRAEPL